MRATRIIFAFAVCVLLTGCATQPPSTAIQQDTQLIRSVQGTDLFGQYCASCHGPEAKGNGIMAPALKAKVPNLTLLARNNNGQFPADRVRNVLDGKLLLMSHGSQEMPVWGPVFHQVEDDKDWGNVRMANLVKFLESIQAGPDPSGAELFNQYCASCHGNDLKGTGSVPEPYKAPPDLTTLARRHGGKFPDVYVLNLLKNGVVIPAHGLADMPAWGTDSRLMDTSNPGQISARIAELVDYLKSKQAK